MMELVKVLLKYEWVMWLNISREDAKTRRDAEECLAWVNAFSPDGTLTRSLSAAISLLDAIERSTRLSIWKSFLRAFAPSRENSLDGFALLPT